MTKIVVSDYDGTFYQNEEDLKKNKQAVEHLHQSGHLFVIATGRSYFDIDKKKEQYRLQYDYCLINHGATIIDSKNNILKNTPISNHIIHQLKQDLNLEQSKSYFCCQGLESRVDFEQTDLTKINVYYQVEQYAIQKVELLNEKYKDQIKAYYVGSNGVEIISNQINKSEAIYWLINKINIPEKNVYTIGDSYNDIEMIQTFHGYCVKQAISEVKKYVKKEYDSVSTLIQDILTDKI